MTQQDKLLRVSQVAEWLELRESTIRSWLLHRRINATRVGRRAIRIPVEEVRRLIEAGTVPAKDGR